MAYIKNDCDALYSTQGLAGRKLSNIRAQTDIFLCHFNEETTASFRDQIPLNQGDPSNTSGVANLPFAPAGGYGILDQEKFNFCQALRTWIGDVLPYLWWLNVLPPPQRNAIPEDDVNKPIWDNDVEPNPWTHPDNPELWTLLGRHIDQVTKPAFTGAYSGGFGTIDLVWTQGMIDDWIDYLDALPGWGQLNLREWFEA